ncbi:hypothetical protein Q4512_09845 [Oceanihabitans sp. 2_MG-2023]|uniref:hypothetical protein n=1 Tax=Oceanihabitans sp. 2_MG-2023 TaxID=3062661 RepID=UPI0026E15126|nr:hypothetical protein [Oceanihabitans sp. 2_MG-2023]MDO6597215.1 hypothetical protein [Oceanihabitans sp. 2_MG-2023]
MQRFIVILITIFSFHTSTYAQKEEQNITQSFVSKNNFLHHEYLEKFAVHTNKTTYFSGEHIWFKAYVAYDITETPNYKTTNLHLNLYDTEKKLIAKQLAYVSNGKVEGKIKIPDTIKTNTYYLQLDTNWNTNFNNTYIKPIKINNLEDGFISSQENTESLNTDTTFQFYPESNVILKNTENTIYFSSTKNNEPIKVHGNVIDKNGEVITEFYSDKNGIGNFQLTPYEQDAYSIKINNSKYKIPQTQETGFIIHKKEKQENKDAISLKITTNKSTIQQEKGNTIFAVIHRKGHVLSVIPITISQEYYSYNLKLLKNDLFNGINTITLFNNKNQPIAERNIFNTNKNQIEIEVTKISNSKDSTTLKINLQNIYTKTNASISVLPEKSLMYQNQNNILSDFLVTPYLNDKTGNAAKYFLNKSTLKNLDTYIQTQNKNHFSVITKNKKSTKKPEIGTRISGSILLNKANSENSRIMLTSQENNIVLVSRLKPNNTFVFDSLLLKQNSNYKLSLIDNKGRLLKAIIKVNEDFIDYKPEIVSNKNLKELYAKNYTYAKIEDQDSKQIKTQEILDEVVIQSKTKKTVLPDDYPDPKVRASSFTKTYQIKENRYSPNETVMDVIKDLPGIEVDVFSTKIRSTRGAKSIIPGSRNDEVAVILNGVRVPDFDLLRSINATEIVEAKVNASGAGYGLDGFAGVVILKTKGETNTIKNSDNTLSTLKIGNVDFGFSISTENYYNEDIQFPTKNSKIYYSTLDWIPNIELKPNTDNFITVYNDNLEHIKLIINGQSDKGDLLFKITTINTKTNSN